MKYWIIYPVHLFEDIDLIKSIEPDKIYLIEDDKYFNSFPFHKAKLTYHRATMEFYHDYLVSKGFDCKYIKASSKPFDKYTWIKPNDLIWSYDPIDHGIRSILNNLACKQTIIIDPPSFMEGLVDLYEYQQLNTNGQKYFHDGSFYKWQRKRLGILMDPSNPSKPKGSAWSFDKSNRNPFDPDYTEPKISKWTNEYWIQASKQINKTFPSNFGSVQEYCLFPLTFEQNRSHLKKFINSRLATFGTFEDGASSNVIGGSHSMLSTSMNVGLITPEYIINQVMKWYSSSKQTKTFNPIQQVEAFVRQVIGWRSYVRFVYEFHGQDMIKENYLGHKNLIPSHWYTQEPNTGFDFINGLIKKAWDWGYLHHIERLMYIGNLLLLTQTKPSEVYKWFMICFLDSYEWVMVPNVMGMSQYSLTSIQMMTRPYFSSSAYIKRMSDFDSEPLVLKNDITYPWEKVWNGLYYNFVNTHSQVLKSIYSTAVQVKNLNNLAINEREELIQIAKLYSHTYGHTR
jgi:deoxyribodipyrimidine photolyase-related protein